jgi:hypothetical protein
VGKYLESNLFEPAARKDLMIVNNFLELLIIWSDDFEVTKKRLHELNKILVETY